MCSEDMKFFEKSPFGEVGLRNRLSTFLRNLLCVLLIQKPFKFLKKQVADNQAKFEEAPFWGIDLPT